MSYGFDTWSRGQTLKLINELQKYPCLYDPRNVHFTNKVIKHEKFNLILLELKKIKPMVTVEIIKRKIRTLKAQIWKEKNKIHSSKRSGSATDDAYEPTLWCYNQLAFLLHCSDSDSSSSNLDLSDIGISESENTQNVQHTHKKPKTRWARSKKLEEERVGALQLSRTYFENRPAIQPLGREEEFCRYLCSILKKIKSEEVFDNLSLKILGLVHNKTREEKQYKNYFTPLSQIEQNSTNTEHIDVSNINIQYPIIYKKPKPYSPVPSTSDLSNDSFQYLTHSQSYLVPTETTSSQDSSDNSLKHENRNSVVVPSNPIPINSNENERSSILRNILLKEPTHQIKAEPTDTSNQKVLLNNTEEITPRPPELLQLAVDRVFYDNIIEDYELIDED